jgi:hypothetical protein
MEKEDELYRTNSAFLIGYYESEIKSLLQILKEDAKHHSSAIKTAEDILLNGQKIWGNRREQHYTDILCYHCM